jgi:DNA-nicking Smr family endonuclease
LNNYFGFAEKRPTQKNLELITGRGANSNKGKPVMKIAVTEWLSKMNYT